MNERIKELLKQATTVEYGVDNGFHRTTVDQEKFAQLMVEEFEKVAKSPMWYSESPSNGWRNPIRHVCGTMKEHFGIK
jgi:hypothetical protein